MPDTGFFLQKFIF